MNESIGLYIKGSEEFAISQFLKNSKAKSAGNPAFFASQINFGGNHNPLILKGGFGANTNCISKFPFSKTRL